MKSEKQIFQDKSQDERLQLLKDNCYRQESMKIKREFSDEEMEQKKNSHVNLSIEINDHDERKKRFMDEYNQEVKPIKSQLKILTVDLKNGYSEDEEIVFAIDDQEDGVMRFYDALGELVYERPLMPSERQTSVISFNKTGTNQ